MFSGLSKVVKDFGTKSLESAYFKEIEETHHEVTIKKPKHILDLKNDEKREFLNSFDLILSDCDGVLWDIHVPIEGAADGINLLKKAGKRIAYVTNNSVRSSDDYLKRFQVAGVETDLDDVLHPEKTIISYLKRIKFDGLIYCIATKYFKDALKEAGFQYIDGPNKILEESYTDLARNVFDKEPVRAVVIDVDFNLSAPKLIRAQQYLTHPDCILIAGATDVLLPVGKGITVIGPGPYSKILSDCTGKQAKILGKPGKELGEIVIEKYAIKNKKRTLFIGDMLEQDIGFGKTCGFQTMAVLTGGCKKEDFEKNSNRHVIPDYYADSMADFIKFFQLLNSKI